jgi:hypothetical protein
MYCPNCYAHRQQQAVEEAAYLAGQKAVVEELSVSSRKVSLVKDLMQKVEWDKPSKIDAQLLPVYRQLMLYFQSQ